jgi:DNA-binding MarR family transcriptional regulator
MELKEFMSVRCACNVVRQEMPAAERLTFEELAILCHLYEAGRELKTSEIADYQGVLRPTMTHRTNHLARLGLIDRHEGKEDRRNVICKISEEGIARKNELCVAICDHIRTGAPLHRSTPERMCKFIDAMGTVFCMSGDMVLLALKESETETLTVSQLVRNLGLLQPTVSMSITTLVEEGLVERNHGSLDSNRTQDVTMLPDGRVVAEAKAEQIRQIIVRRNRRATAEA